MPIKRATRKPRRKAPARRRMWRRKGARVALPKRTTGNFASATETFSLACTAGQVYDFTFSLHDLVRTNGLLSVYQFYRITSVEMKFKPQSDTFVAGGGAALPYLYFQYDKSGALSGLNAQGFEDIGTKPIRLDDKTISRKWRPSVLTDTPDGNITQFKVSPWLPTHFAGLMNDQVLHYGSTYYISKQNPSDATAYDIDVIVNVQYRKPLVAPVGEPNPNPVRIKQGNMTQIDLSLNPSLAT